MGEEFKQVIVVRSDIKMSKGKLAVQVAHAAVEAVIKCIYDKNCSRYFELWRIQGQKKIVVKVKSLEELLDIKKHAEELNIVTALIVDAGLTELQPGTITALGIGPAPSEIIDKITKSLPLL